MRDRKALLLLCVLPPLVFAGCTSPAGNFTGVNALDPQQHEVVDRVVAGYTSGYSYINVALVQDGEVVLTKSYGRNRLDKDDVYASVSKPVTAMIFMQLLQAGKIKSIDDEIGLYSEAYANVLPDAYAGTPITFEHLLTHQSGIPHLSEMWDGEKLKLSFRPGEEVLYSSNAYGVLGEVMEEITGIPYPRQVEEYIGKSVGAPSVGAKPWFQSPAGQVYSTIHDMARFAIGVMNEKYVSSDLLYQWAFHRYADDQYGEICLGWYCKNLGEPDLTIFHAGSNGRPRAYLHIKPQKGLAVAITGLNKSENGVHDFGDLSLELMTLLEEW